MSIQPVSLFDLDFFEPLPIQIEVSDAPLTSDAGLLPLRQFDERIGLTTQFAGRSPRSTRSRPHRPFLPRHGPHAHLRHPRRLRGPERPRHLAHRSRLQAHRRSLARGRRPGQSADSVPLREPDRHSRR